MPKVTVYFGGICTFFTTGYPALNGYLRAVLVNASRETRIAHHEIAPHRATVTINNEPAVPLHGLHMRLLSSNLEPAQIVPFIFASLNLKELVAQSGGELSPPSAHVVFGSDPAAAALYFDFRGGSLTAGRNEQDAVVTTLVVEAEQVMLETAAFQAGPLPDGWPAERYFHEDTVITVMNDDDIEQASDFDFLLHYRTAEKMPPSPPVPSTEDIAAIPKATNLPPPLTSIGAGCSNSNYP